MSAARHLLILRLAYDGGRRMASRTASRLGAFAIVALATVWPLLTTAPSRNEFRDAQVLAHYESAARESVLTWHELPLWDPYYCGGAYLLGTPQSRFVSPTFLLTLLFGEARGESLAVFAMLIVGLEGTFRYGRSRGATALGAMLAAPAFALSGVFAVSSSLGWVNFYGFELLPWMALGTRRALEGERMGIVALALSAAFCVGFGGTYAAPIAVVWCALEVATHAVARWRTPKRLGAALGVAAAGALFALSLSAVRLLPIAETLGAAHRIVGGAPGATWADLARMLFQPSDGDNALHGAFYLGVPIIPAVILGLARSRGNAGVILAGIVFVWLAAGYRAEPSLFAALHHVPIYSTLRYPERFLVPFTFALVLLAARGISFAQALPRTQRIRRSPRWTTAAYGALAVCSVALVCNLPPLASQHWARDDGRSTTSPPDEAEAPRPFRQARGNRWALEYYRPLHRGSLSCWDAYPVPQSPLLRGDLAAEEYLRDSEAGEVTERSWSPNAIDLAVRLARPGTVVVNQNWHPGWRTNVGEVRSDRGLLTVALPAGDHRLSLRFVPSSATIGSLVSLIALAGLVLLGLQARRAPRVCGGRDATGLAFLTVAPAVPLIVTALIARGDTHLFEPMAADATGIVVDRPADGAIRSGTKLEGNLELEAVRLSDPNPAAGTDITIELDWRRGAEIPRGVGVFVHIEPSKGDTLNADHVLLSGQLDFDDAPSFATLRDVFPVHVPADSKGKVWKIWAGLWKVRDGATRLRVVDAGSATVVSDSILVASYQAR